MSQLPTRESFLDSLKRDRLAVLDAGSIMDDDALCRVLSLTPQQLKSYRDDPLYQQRVEAELNELRGRVAMIHYDVQRLGTKAVENLDYYLTQRQERHNWDATKFTLEAVLPNKEQSLKVNMVEPHFDAKVVLFLQDKLPGLVASLADLPTIDLDSDPHLTLSQNVAVGETTPRGSNGSGKEEAS